MIPNQNAQLVAALQGAQPGGMMAGPPPQLQQLAGTVSPMQPNTNIPAQQLYDRVLQQPSGAAAVRQNGGLMNAPPNVVPINPAVQQRMGSIPGQQMAENTVDWSKLPLRDPRGVFISPQGSLQSIGPAMFRNGMRNIGLKPTEYNKKD